MTIRYQEYGDPRKSLMVFLHGGGVSDWMWEQQIRYFSHYHCIVPTLAEHGQSNNTDLFSIKGCAEEILRLIDEKAMGKEVIIVGFSLGAQILVQMLGIKPNIANFSIIISASVRPLSFSKKLIKPMVALSFPLIKYRWFSRLQAKTLYIGEEYFERYYKESSQIKRDTLIRILEENMSFGLPKDFPKATGKILVMVGEKEKSLMKKSAKDLVHANPNCIGVVIPNIGHGVPLAMPDYFNQLVEKWIINGILPEECLVFKNV